MFTKTIEEVTETLIDYRGKTPPKTDCGVKLITAKIIKDGFVQNSNLEYISEETYETWMRRGMPKQWDILITTEAPLGEVAQLRTTEKIALAQRVILLRGNPQVINQQYYFQALKSSFVQAGLQMRATGTTVAGIKQSELRQVEIPLPPLPIQRKIAAVLSAYDDLIENNTHRIKILEEMARLIYREWFVEFRFPGHEGVEMVESELGLIPQGWEVKPLGDVTSIITKGTTPTTLGKQFTNEGINFIKVQSIDEQGDILDDKLTNIDDETHELLKRSQLQESDILFSIAGAIGRVATVPKRFLPANTNQALAVIRPSDLSFTAYLYRTLRSPEFLNYSLERVVQTAQANVSLSVLSSAPVIMPTKIMVDNFNKHLTPITTFVDTLREKNANLRQTRDLLLPKLISGEIDVSELDIDIYGKE